MKPENDKILVERYPKIFNARKKRTTPEPFALFGFEHGDGWFTIIDQLCSNIQHYIDNREKDREWAIAYNKMIESCKNNDWELFDARYKNYDSRFLASERENVLNQTNREVHASVPQVVALQVKEKFGTLRFYYSGGDQYISGLVSMAESMSGVTCEVCASPGTTSGPGWVRTLCETHKKNN